MVNVSHLFVANFNWCSERPKLNEKGSKDVQLKQTIMVFRAVVVAQLVERSLPIREVRGSNPVISKNLFIY